MTIRDCLFCRIVARQAPASFVYEDDVIAAFMTLQPTAPGECLIIPKAHVDHFVDLSDDVAQRIMLIAQRLGRRMRESFALERVGYLVHGYGVAHAHFIVVPQQGPHHLTSERFARIVDGQIVFDLSRVPVAERSVLDENAAKLAIGSLSDAGLMESVVVGDDDLEIAEAEARMRSAQLSSDARALAEMISDDLLFAGPDGALASKAQDLEAHASGVVRFREHEPEDFRVRRVGSSVAISSLRARLAVEVAGELKRGVFRYTRVWHRENGEWRVAGGHVSEIQYSAEPQ